MFDVGLEDSRKVTGLVASYGQRIDETRRELGEKNVELQELRSSLKSQSQALKALMGELEGLRSREAREPQAVRPADLASEHGAGDPQPPSALFRASRRFASAAAAAGVPGRTRSESRRQLRGGHALDRRHAPTDGGARPVHLAYTTCIGPNRSMIPIQACFLIGKATGEPNSLRVVIQLDRLSYVKRDGRAIEVPLNGFVADQDGVMGLSGQYVWRIGESLFLAGGVGAIQGLSDALAQGQTTTQLNPLGGATSIVTGDLGKFAGARGASAAANKMGEIVTKRLDQIVPAVYTENGRKLTVILIDGVTLTGLEPKEVQHESSRSPYQGLDFDR
jgi:hypothetical protein